MRNCDGTGDRCPPCPLSCNTIASAYGSPAFAGDDGNAVCGRPKIHLPRLSIRAKIPNFGHAEISPQSRPTAAKPVAAKAPAKGDHVFLVDGSGYIFRAYHALPPLTRKSDGLQVNAVLGFCNMLWKLLRDMKPEERPTHLAVVFDKSEKTFRNEIYPDYKAHRPAGAGRPDPAVPADPRGGARLRPALPRAGRLRGRRPDRDLCAAGLRGAAPPPPSCRPTRT